MTKLGGKARGRGTLDAADAEKLFSTVDETGHTNEETAARQRKMRSQGRHGVDVDPLSDKDPSGSNVGEVMTRTTTIFLVVFFLAVVTLQVSCGVVRRVSTRSLGNEASISSVVAAMSNGVEWGNGYTQFPEDFSVQEADENTHRIEVTVTDTSSSDVLGVFSTSQIQAAALATNALMNPDINTVIYNVNVHVNKAGKIQTSRFFGYLKPTGELKTLMTFIWTKTATAQGVRFNCSITGVDSATEKQLRKSITNGVLDQVFGPSADDKSTSGTDGGAGGILGVLTSGTNEKSTDGESGTDVTSTTDNNATASATTATGEKNTADAATGAGGGN
ncbi:hypothetical protein [Parafannyhessea umbonata]|uniref:Uncharacterized protein n=1 Tax=Parafannyhessea umbonata TaxID=604330 RepID=A0A1G6MDM6_9ACTN|nr:hypothetical protein [Parafannyhessea umbonata]SDC53551.1 hypothetical protein SAMN04487824_12026 [Parafannyhessea umbonata]